MTNHRFFPRAVSFTLATLITSILLTGIDTLARSEYAANSLLAHTTTLAGRPA